jgi:HEAT repeat protein
MSHIFISYNQEDADFAAVVMTTLEKAGFDTWMDKNRLRPGSDWSQEIDQGILTALAVVLVMSPHSRASEYVTFEWSYALGAGVRVVPLLRRETQIHPRLSRLQHLNFSGTVRPWNDLIRELESVKAEGKFRWAPPRDTPPHLQRAMAELDSANVADRRGALVVLNESDHEIAVLALRRALTHPFRDVRVRAAIGLASRKDQAATSEASLRVLIGSLVHRSDEVQHIASAAKDALRAIGQPAYSALVETTQSTTDPARFETVDLLSGAGGSESIPLLIQLLEDSNMQIVRAAAQQLGALKVKETAPRIMRLLLEAGDDEDPPIFGNTLETHKTTRAIAARSLVEIGDKSIEPQLLEATCHQAPEVRMFGAWVLARLCGTTAIPVLAKLLNDTDSTHYAVLGAFGKHHLLMVSDIAAKSLDEINTPHALDLIRKFRSKHPFSVVQLSIDNK